MAVSKRTRLTISVPNEINDRLEQLADRMGISKTQVCSIMIGQTLPSWEKTWGIFSDPNSLGEVLNVLSSNPAFQQGVEAGERVADAIIASVEAKSKK